MNRKVVVGNQSEKKARSVVPNFLKPKKRLSVHLGRGGTGGGQGGSVGSGSSGNSGNEQIINPSRNEKYDIEAQLGGLSHEHVVGVLNTESSDNEYGDYGESKSPASMASGHGPRGSLFGRKSLDLTIPNTPGERNSGRRSTLRKDELSPELRNALDRRLDDALLTSLDQPSYSGTGTIADLRLTPAYSVALKANEDALIATANILGEDHPDVIQRKISTADIYKGLGMMREAAEMLEEVMDYQRRTRNTNPEITPELLLTLNELGLIYTSLGRFSDAENLFQEVVHILSKSPDVQPDAAVALGNLAISLRKARQYIKAIPIHERAIKIMGTIMGKDHAETIYQRGHYAVTIIHSGEEARGTQLLQEAIEQLEKRGLRADHIWMKLFRNELRSNRSY